MIRSALFALALASVRFSGCSSPETILPQQSPEEIPRADREFRAVWVATVDNIDWPSVPGLSPEQQRREALAILDSASALGLNAVILQVRPHCDAMYASTLEPWSPYLTGLQGKAPDPLYDPLVFWVEEAHARGLELHAWFNPYRAHLQRGGEITENSVVRKHPELVRQLENGTYWLDPARRETQDLSFNVVMDVVKRYEIDGVHFDDYFYPYGDGNFPDDSTWSAYRASGGTLARADWRRAAVNGFIERVYKGIKTIKPQVKFGLSPFGIWRPGYPRGIGGFDQFTTLYADARLWLQNGWVDYWSPQLYWPIRQVAQSFPVLLGWWGRQNVQERHIWPGLFTSRMTDARGADELVNEIMVARGFFPDAPGHIHFSMRALQRDSSALNRALREGPYHTGALVPACAWLHPPVPPPPRMQVASDKDSVRMSWRTTSTAEAFKWVVYLNYGSSWEYAIKRGKDTMACVAFLRPAPVSGRSRTDTLQNVQMMDTLRRVAVTSVNRMENESDLVITTVARPPALP